MGQRTSLHAKIHISIGSVSHVRDPWNGTKPNRADSGDRSGSGGTAPGTKPEQALDQAKAKGGLSGEKTTKMSKMLMEMWSLNVDRMTEPATLEALRAGKMPDPALKRP
ncbi:hypothetical protein EBX31_09105 [bacterium]|nr:hypothetical protein [bacterium]